MVVLTEEMRRCYERAIHLCPEDYEWGDLSGQCVLLKVLSIKDQEWKNYWLTDETCSCQNWKFCYHAALLKLSGGVAGVKIRLHVLNLNEPKGTAKP